jgi:hypothetical protein
MEDIYRNPGPLQFEGPGAETKPISLCVEDQDYMGRIKQLQEYLEKVFYQLRCSIFALSKNDTVRQLISSFLAHKQR